MMLFRLFIMLGLPILLGGVVTVWAAKRVLAGPLKPWSNRRLGRKNMKRLTSGLVAETCCMCEGQTNPSVDVYTGHSWIHKTCFEKMQKGEF